MLWLVLDPSTLPNIPSGPVSQVCGDSSKSWKSQNQRWAYKTVETKSARSPKSKQFSLCRLCDGSGAGVRRLRDIWKPRRVMQSHAELRLCRKMPREIVECFALFLGRGMKIVLLQWPLHNLDNWCRLMQKNRQGSCLLVLLVSFLHKYCFVETTAIKRLKGVL